MKAIFLCENKHNINYVYGPAQQAALKRLTGLDGHVYTLDEARGSEEARGAEVIFSTWGMPEVEYAEIPEVFPALRAVFLRSGLGAGLCRAVHPPGHSRVQRLAGQRRAGGGIHAGADYSGGQGIFSRAGAVPCVPCGRCGALQKLSRNV